MYIYGCNVYIILSTTSDDDYDSGGAEGPWREKEKERWRERE